MKPIFKNLSVMAVTVGFALVLFFGTGSILNRFYVVKQEQKHEDKLVSPLSSYIENRLFSQICKVESIRVNGKGDKSAYIWCADAYGPYDSFGFSLEYITDSSVRPGISVAVSVSMVPEQ